MGLERVRRLLALLKDPQDGLRIVQVVGTNGKGTTAVALAGALTAAGHPAGAYLSPHVLSYTERVMVEGRFVSERRFADAMGETILAAERHGIPASQFELLTAGALRLFADEGLGWAVLEAGLGARHDATSAVRAEAVVLTNVGLDHAEYLGDTVEEVAREKLASISSGSMLVLGDPAVRELARARCAEVGARLVEIPPEGHDAYRGLPPFVVRDASLGVGAARELLGEDRGPASEVFREIVGALPGRFEAHEVDGVPVVVDGAHNPPGMAVALEGMTAAYPGRPVAAVFGVLRDKDARSMLTGLRSAARTVVLTRPEGERAEEPAAVSRALQGTEGGQTLTEEDPVEAVRAAVRSVRGEGGAVLVVGSFGTAAPVLRWLRD